MSTFGTNIGQSVAGAPQAERAAGRPAPKASGEVRRSRRGAEEPRDTAEVNFDDPVRKVESNDKEEARQDHREHPAYTPEGVVQRADKPKLDVQG